MSSTENPRPAIKRAIVVIGVIMIVVVGWSGFKVWSAWQDVDRVGFNTESAREALGAAEPGSNTVTPDPTTTLATMVTATTEAAAATTITATTAVASTMVPPPFLDRGRLNAFLVMGVDDSTKRADVILLVMLPPDSGDAVMVSIPRDLFVFNPCQKRNTKINENLWGCPSVGVSGPEQLAVAIEDFTGIPIDHFARFTFPSFEQIIDHLGGVEICVGEYPIRDLNEDFDDFQMPAGCSNADGEQALSWMRSRRTQQLTESGWQTMPDINDLTRNERQQEMLLTALERLKQIGSIPELQGLVAEVSDAFTIDDELGFGEVVALLWDVRTISSDDIYRVALDVRFSSDEIHGDILLLNTPFEDAIIDVYPPAREFLEE